MSSKTELRRRHRAARADLDADQLARRRRLLAEVLTDIVRPEATVAAYRAMPGEPDPGAFLTAHLGRGGAVLLPRIVPGDQRRLEWVPWQVDAPMRRSSLAPVDEPVGAPVPLQAEVMLVPALAVGRDGARLGQGGGYYDRLLGPAVDAPADQVERIAVVHGEELLPAGEIPLEPHDLRVERAVTEEGLVPLDAAR